MFLYFVVVRLRMKELQPTKANRITIPTRVKRFAVAYYTNSMGWENSQQFFTTPESAIENFLRFYKDQTDDYAPKFYSVYEVDLEIPVINDLK